MIADRAVWCIECGVAIGSDGQPNPEGAHAPGANLSPDCVYCRTRAESYRTGKAAT